MEWVKLILGWLKPSPTHLVALLTSSLFLLLANEAILKKMGLLGFREGFLPWIGAVALLSGFLLFAHSVFGISGWVKKRIIWWINLRRMQRYLHSLTPGEKQILRGYFHGTPRPSISAYPTGW